jgi:hypothetical protein
MPRKQPVSLMLWAKGDGTSQEVPGTSWIRPIETAMAQRALYQGALDTWLRQCAVAPTTRVRL